MMQLRILIITCCFLLMTISFVFGQVDFRSFPLDSFQLPDIDRSALTASGSFFGSYTQTRINGFDVDDNNSTVAPIGQLNYSRFVNRQDLQSLWTASMRQSYLSTKNENSLFTQDRDRREYNPTLNIDGTNRAYHGKRFFLTGANGSMDYNYLKTVTDESGFPEETTINQYDFSVAVSVGLGNGRIEPINDVAMAMFVLHDAIYLGINPSFINTSSIYEFASLMAEVRNRRIFDSRRMRIQELRDLYSFMLRQNWTIPDDPGFFTVLTDNWINNDFYFRTSGSRWTFSLTPSYTRNSFQTVFVGLPERNWSSEIGAAVKAEFVRHEPISLYRDHFHEHAFSIYGADREQLSDFFNPGTTYLLFSFENTFGRNWFPNNRTRITAGLDIDMYNYHVLETTFTPTRNQAVVRPGLSAQCSYYISPQTQFTASAQIQYTYSSGGNFIIDIVNGTSTNAETNGFHARLNASILISLF